MINTNMNIIAVDDEIIALHDLEYTIRKAFEQLTIEHKETSITNLSCFSMADEVIPYAKNIDIHLAFLDINMTGMNGIDLAKNLKEINDKTNIVFTTGHKKYALDAFSLCASDYLLKPVNINAVVQAIRTLRFPVKYKQSKKLKVQCFGNFEVFLDDKTLHFPREKAKELFAYLVHKKGSGCSTREITAVLYKNKENSISLQKQIQTVISTMIKALNDSGVMDVIEKKRNSISVNAAKIDCDYLRFLQGDTHAINSYTGEYMNNYSWAKFTAEHLEKKDSKE
ncbi:MAG: response regulator [Treponema sp.]|nr:response regulator [Treponema sp.]